MGYKPPPRFTYQLDDYGMELRVTCRSCGHRIRIAAAYICRVLIERSRSQALHRVGEALRCSICGARSPAVEAKPIADDRELAEERRRARS